MPRRLCSFSRCFQHLLPLPQLHLGYRLQLSATSWTGLRNVRPARSPAALSAAGGGARFETAVYLHGRERVLGSFGTPLEAAVRYAQLAEEEREQALLAQARPRERDPAGGG